MYSVILLLSTLEYRNNIFSIFPKKGSIERKVFPPLT